MDSPFDQLLPLAETGKSWRSRNDVRRTTYVLDCFVKECINKYTILQLTAHSICFHVMTP